MSMERTEALSCHCLCGAVRFTAVPLKPEMGVCHCAMCRRWSGGVFMAVECHDLVVEDDSELGIFESSAWAERGFCRACGSSLFWRMREGTGDHLAVSFQSFDNPDAFAFSEEIFIDEKPAQYAFAGDRPRKSGAEIFAEFGAEQAE
jgi:hypothetical protein